MGIGKILANLIEERKMNVNELAKSAGISPSTLYSMIKRDSMKVDIEVLIKASKCLGVSADYFYDMYEQGEVTKFKQNIFSTDEQNLIKKYRALDDRGKKAIDDNLEREYSFVNSDVKEQAAILTPENEKELADFRRELEAEQKVQLALQNLEKAE